MVTQDTQDTQEQRANEIKARLHKAPANLPEAGGIAWAEVYTPSGNKINLTARADDPISAFENLYTAIEYAMKMKGCTATKVLESAPTQAYSPPATTTAVKPVVPGNLPPNEAGIQIINVESVSHQVKGAQHVVVVKGGAFKKYGIVAWREVLPDEVKASFESWELMKELAPPASMVRCMVDKKKVISFTLPPA